MRETVRKAIALRRMLSVLIFQFSILTFQFSIVGCTKADISYIEKVVVKGSVQIYPDMSEYTLPEVQYYFYNADDETEYFCLDSDENGNFEGALPVGTYRVIATNTSAANVAFSGMEHYETAVASANNINETRNSSLSLLTQPDPVYSIVLSDLVVTDAGTVRYPMSVLLTKQLKLVFGLQGELQTEVSSLSGVLSGVYPFVHLYSCTAPSESVQQAVGTAVKFDTEADGDQRQAQISLFGLCDPEYGEANTLTLNLTMTDGTTATGTLDLPEKLSENIQNNQGTVEVSLTVSAEKVGTQLSIVIEQWHQGGSGSGDF